MNKIIARGAALATALGTLTTVALAFFGSTAVNAQTYPTRPITTFVPATAGGPTDTIGRIITARMQQTLGQNVVIENVGGASGTIATGRAVRADADGYTLIIGGLNHFVVNGAVYTLNYSLLDDFVPISMLANGPQIISSKKDLPAKDLKELIVWLKQNADKVTFATGGIASPPHISGLSLEKVVGAKFTYVPFRGAGPAMQNLVSGHVDILIDQASSSLAQVRNGAIHAYAVTAKQRLASAPDLPTVDEAGLPGFYVSVWQGLWAPKGTPPAVVEKLAAAVREALADAEVQKRLKEIGQELPTPEQQTPAGFRAFQKAEQDKWWPIIKAADIKVDAN
jgi:tripartite-type tricarboxylate transporter receptor subunit TctC